MKNIQQKFDPSHKAKAMKALVVNEDDIKWLIKEGPTNYNLPFDDIKKICTAIRQME